MGVTPKHALRYPAGTDPNDVPTDLNELALDVESVMASFLHGTFAARPAASKSGRVYFATDTVELFYDTGAAWHELSIGDYASKLSLSGGTMSGTLAMADQLITRPKFQDVSEAVTTVGAAGAARALDQETANVFDVTLDQNVTFTFTNPPAAGSGAGFTLILRQPAALKTVTWPASVKWPSATAPVFAASTVNMLTFVSVDGGVTWLGGIAGLDIR